MTKKLETWLDCVKALIDGETLESSLGTRIHLGNGGELYNKYGTRENETFSSPQHWSIVEQKVTITKTQLMFAARKAYLKNGPFHTLAEELGFKS